MLLLQAQYNEKFDTTILDPNGEILPVVLSTVPIALKYSNYNESQKFGGVAEFPILI